jgi:TolA-binding protein
MAYPAFHGRLSRVPLTLLAMTGFLIAASAFLNAETSTPEADLRRGIELFRGGAYEKAIPVLEGILLSQAAEPQKPAASLLLAKSYMAMDKLKDAERYLELFLAQYPSSQDYPEALYQKGRLLFLQEDFESVIQLFQAFLGSYPKSPLVPNAWYWVGESLYSLGRLDEARIVYQKVAREYPASVKAEAAQYRLSLIDTRKREIELARLLKWSHEEFLRSIEEYQRREGTYQQALEAYQKKLATARIETPAVPQQPPPSASEKETAAAAAALKEQQASLARMLRLIAIKQEALALKEQYLTWIASAREKAK